MKIRKDLARLFLFIATVYWGIWLGGYIFNALMVVPGWSHNPPDSILSYTREPHFLLYLFSAVIIGTVNLYCEGGERNWFQFEGVYLSDKKISKLE